MQALVLGVGEYGAVKGPEEIIKTYALGSCVAVVVLDPETRCVAMDHVALPESQTAPDKAVEKPGYFADTGIPALMQKMQTLGTRAGNRKLIVKLVGGANVMDSNNTFNIGKRNVLAIKKELWKFGLGAVSEDVGGSISRTVAVDTLKGKVRISSPGRDDWEI